MAGRLMPLARRRLSLGAVIVTLAFVAGPLGAATASQALPVGAGTGAYSNGYNGFVEVYDDGVTHHLYVATFFCTTDTKLGHLEFKVTPDLTTASILKSTKCGVVNYKWTSASPIRASLGCFYRAASAQGYVGST